MTTVGPVTKQHKKQEPYKKKEEIHQGKKKINHNVCLGELLKTLGEPGAGVLGGGTVNTSNKNRGGKGEKKKKKIRGPVVVWCLINGHYPYPKSAKTSTPE